MWFTKKILAPKSNENKEVTVLQTWEVRWTSRYGQFSSDTQNEIVVFLSEAEAQEFQQALKQAFILIRHTSRTSVELIRR